MGDLVLVQFGPHYDQRQINTMVDILERTFSNISTVYARVNKSSYQITYNITPVGNIGTGEDDLMTYTLPANVLAKNGYNIQITAWGTFAANANNKTLKAKFGATTIYNTGALSVNGGTWQITSTITRTGDATEQAITSIVSSNTTVANSVTYSVPTETLSGTIVIKLTGTGTSNNDIVQNGLLIKVYPQE